VKARLLDQSVLAGVGNLLADETLWQAAVSPSAPADELSERTLDGLYDALERSLKAAIANGGVHTGEVIEHRRAGGRCPRCGAEMVHGTVGGRSTWWCSAEQLSATTSHPADGVRSRVRSRRSPATRSPTSRRAS
jgi:formamidopyrimidine-DNA glycosylase